MGRRNELCIINPQICIIQPFRSTKFSQPSKIIFCLILKNVYTVFFYSLLGWLVGACDTFPSNQQWIEFHLFVTYLYFLKFMRCILLLHILVCSLLFFVSTSLHLFLFHFRCDAGWVWAMRLEWNGGEIQIYQINKHEVNKKEQYTQSEKRASQKSGLSERKKSDNILANCVRLVTQYCR